MVPEISETNIHTCIVSGDLSTWLFFRGQLGLAVGCGVFYYVEDRVAISTFWSVYGKKLPHVANNLEMHPQNVIQPLLHL
jgi:hypothetical protein